MTGMWGGSTTCVNMFAPNLWTRGSRAIDPYKRMQMYAPSQRYRTSIVSYAFDLGTTTHESEIGSIANDQLFVVTDSMKINKGCITKFQAWYMMHRCKNRCIEWELVTFLWSVEISTASLSVVCICILTDGAINKKHIYEAWRWWWGLAAAPAEAWKPNSIRAESGLPIVKQHPHLKHNYHF